MCPQFGRDPIPRPACGGRSKLGCAKQKDCTWSVLAARLYRARVKRRGARFTRSPRMLKGVFAATLLVLSTSLVSGFVTTPGLDFTHCPREGVLRHGSRVLSPRMEAPKLGQVRLPACKKLCPGCEPWICPLAPQGQDANEPHSESAARLLELREEQELV